MISVTPKIKKSFAIGCTLLFILCAIGYINRHTLALEYEALQCDIRYPNLLQKSDCWDSMTTKHFHAHGVVDALQTLQWLYNHEPEYPKTVCHQHAHLIGDLSYYYLYTATGDFSDIPFVELEEACGYGFFGGILEHIVQNHPDPTFMVSLCEQLVTEYQTATGRGFAHMCYHATAHGLMLARADHLPKSAWGNIKQFIDTPLDICDTLPKTDRYKESCRQGIFHQLYLWMNQNAYSFSMSTKLFDLCSTVRTSARRMCIFSTAQRTDYFKDLAPEAVWHLLDQELAEEYVPTAFTVAIGNMVMPIIHTDPLLITLVASCNTLPQRRAELCIAALVDGLYIYGPPMTEYKAAIDFCASQGVASEATKKACFTEVVEQNKNHYSPTTTLQLCTQFPAEFQDLCRRATTSSTYTSLQNDL